jgi:hypothetical protein
MLNFIFSCINLTKWFINYSHYKSPRLAMLLCCLLVYVLLNYAVSSPGYCVECQNKVNIELEQFWTDVIAPYFELLSGHLPGRLREEREILFHVRVTVYRIYYVR